jgi:hypothetical protein
MIRITIRDAKSARFPDQIAPESPKNQVAGIPTARQITEVTRYAVNTDFGDSIARRAIAGPYAALHKIEPSATAGRR